MANQFQEKNPFFQVLQGEILEQDGLEAKIDQLRKFKKKHTLPLQTIFLKNKIKLPELMEQLSNLADAILMGAHELAIEALSPIYGIPHYRNKNGAKLPADFALVGMGSLGSQEVHFSSDLDLIFIFNQKGETQGPKHITNKEYFSKLTQRIINYLSLHTRHGFAYKVDAELRPSGNAGTLVTAMGPWLSYYRQHAQTWEKQALLKARLIETGEDFAREFNGVFKRLIFLNPFPGNLAEEIHHLRMRIEKELAKESKDRWNFKKGYGGLVDIEFTIQYIQLKNGMASEDILQGNTLKAIQSFENHSFLSAESLKILKKAYYFYRKLGMVLELKFQLMEGYLNKKNNIIKELSQAMSFNNEKDFLTTFKKYREEVRNIYLKALNVGKGT